MRLLRDPSPVNGKSFTEIAAVPPKTSSSPWMRRMARQPLDLSTMLGAQVSNDQLEKILSYIEIGKEEGAKVLTGRLRVDPDGDLPRTVFDGNNAMRIFLSTRIRRILS